MAKLLYITCDLKPVEQSTSLQIGKAFLDSYLRLHPDDEIHCLDLYRDNIQRIDIDVLTGWEKLKDGVPFGFLNEDEQRKITRIWRSTDQFIAVDKYLFVTPMFNLGFPAEFKMYIDAICVAGKTYVQTPSGPLGLLNDQGKKCLHIHASGGFHLGREEDHSVSYLRSIMAFMGIRDFEAIVAEGMEERPELAEQLKRQALEKAISAARRF